MDSGANTVAPVLLSVKFLRSVLPENCIQPFFDNVTRSMSGADGKGSLAMLGQISVMLAICPVNENAAPFLLKGDAALMEPLSSEVIISGELLLQNGAAMYHCTTPTPARGRRTSGWTN